MADQEVSAGTDATGVVVPPGELKGLSGLEAQRRLAQYGENAIAEKQ